MTITEIRHELHNHPGVSGQEEFAHDLIVSELQALKPDELYDHVGGYGVIALWRASNKGAKTYAFRADIYALPSGHRCGHDGHTAILLRFAQLISQHKNSSHSNTQTFKHSNIHNIVLIFQPAEETGEGARRIMQSGILQRIGVDAIFGLHNLPGYEKGTMVLSRGTFSMASCGVIYKFIGRQTHASTPELGLNPGLAIAEMIQRFDALNLRSADVSVGTQTLSADPTAHHRQSTLICCRIGEEAFGTSAGIGDVMFTLRAVTNDAMSDLLSEADDIANDAACKYGLKLEKQLREPFRALENTPELVDQIITCLQPDTLKQSATGMPHLQTSQHHYTSTPLHTYTMLTEPFRWSEDFAEYLTEFKGVFFGLGSGISQPELHHPDYDFPDDIIETGAEAFRLIIEN